MKLFPIYIIVLCLIASCKTGTHSQSYPIDRNTLEKSVKTMRLIRDDLYADSLGNVFHRTLDRSAADNPNYPEHGLVYSYRDYLRLDSVSKGEHFGVFRDMRDIVDTTTFHQIKSSDGFLKYEDARHTYWMKIVSDGGTLEATPKPETVD